MLIYDNDIQVKVVNEGSSYIRYTEQKEEISLYTFLRGQTRVSRSPTAPK